MAHDPKDPATLAPKLDATIINQLGIDQHGHTTSEDLEDHVEAPLHEQVFGTNPEGSVNDTPKGAIGASVNLGFSPVQLEPHQPLRHIGDNDQGDFQPGGGKRR